MDPLFLIQLSTMVKKPKDIGAELKLLIKEEKYALTGHDPSLVNKVFPE